ncbi:MAG TPA: MCP four helix bundle domain-containing protein, partial [Steroidobacteraceae bacterium]
MKSPGRRWENLRIALKLAVSFAAILIIVITLGTLAVARLSTLAQNSRDISRTSMPSITHLSAMAIAQWSVRTAEFREVVSMSNDEASKYIQLEGERMATFERERQAADRLLTDDHERQLWARYAQQWSLYLELKARVSDMMLHGQKEQAQQLLYAQGRTLFDASLATLQELITHNVEEGNERADESDVIYHNARLLIIAMIAAATLIGTVVSMLAARGIVRPVREAITIFNSIAGGRLDNRIDTGRTDEI